VERRTSPTDTDIPLLRRIGIWLGATMKLSETITISDYWTDEEREFDIATREALALDKALSLTFYKTHGWTHV